MSGADEYDVRSKGKGVFQEEHMRTGPAVLHVEVKKWIKKRVGNPADLEMVMNF